MAVSSSSVQLILFLFCTSYQYHVHALLASTTPSSDHTSGHDNDDAVPMPVPAINFFHDAPPPLWSKAKGWPADHVFSSGTLPKLYKGSGGHHLNMHTDANSSDACGDNCTSRTVGEGTMNHVSSASAAPVTSNGTTGALPPLHQHQEQGVHLRRRKSGAAAIKTRKPPGVYHRTARLLKDRTDCKFGAGNGVVVVASSAALLVLLCNLAVAGLLLRCMHRKRRGEISAAAVDLDDDDKPVLRPELLRQVTGPLRYSYRMLVTATSNFAESNRIGRGGFGSVYGGYLHNQDRHVAIKMFSADMGSPELGSREFEAEIKVMSGLRHRNLVQLVGWCDRQRHLLLVYELVPGGSLDKHLHDPERLLTWAERYRIALGLGSAIHYLHTECDQCVVVHGDIKTSNVMLDSSRDAKLGDFGLARLVPHGDEPQTTEVVAGTVGYMDPEFVASQKRGTESDIYSFGVVLLEIACGRRPASSGQRKEASMLLKRVREMYDRNAILDAADGRLNGEFDERQMERVLVTGLWCAHREQCRRPSIAQAMSVLRSDGNTVLPVLPESHGCGQVFRSFEEQAYGDLSPESDGSMGSSAATAYDTPEDWSCPLGEDS